MDDEPESLTEAAEWLRTARDVVVFTGAGISAESGIPTFRDDAGFWQEFPPERFATWAGLLSTAAVRPRRLAEFVHAVIAPIARATPNAAHVAVSDLEKHTGVTVVTQNIDGLHQAAGSTIVHEIHGSLLEIVTLKRRFVRLLSRQDLLRVAGSLDRARRGPLVLPRVFRSVHSLFGVGRRGFHRPNVVLFGDALAEPDWGRSLEAARQCELMISIGTSGSVWPAAMLPGEARAAGACVIGVDPNRIEGDVHLRGPASRILPALVRKAFEG